MKNWTAPALEELDVNMTMGGNVTAQDEATLLNSPLMKTDTGRNMIKDMWFGYNADGSVMPS